MPIRSFPFTVTEFDKNPRPRLPIKIISLKNGASIPHWALIDTGADNCCLPAKYAEILGYNLKDGILKKFDAVGGKGTGYIYPTKFEIYDIKTNKIVLTRNNTRACFVEGLQVVIFGVNTFLKDFILEINYPLKKFSIISPPKSR